MDEEAAAEAQRVLACCGRVLLVFYCCVCFPVVNVLIVGESSFLIDRLHPAPPNSNRIEMLPPPTHKHATHTHTPQHACRVNSYR